MATAIDTAATGTNSVFVSICGKTSARADDVQRGVDRHGHVFSVGGGSDLRLGGNIYPPQLPKISPAASKKKKGRWFLQKVFYYVEKIAISPPTSFGRRYGGPWGYIPPPTPMSGGGQRLGEDDAVHTDNTVVEGHAGVAQVLAAEADRSPRRSP
jgi:hypothetical protein